MCVYRHSRTESKNNQGKQTFQVHRFALCVPPLQVNAKVCCKQTVPQGYRRGQRC